ncbi:MAG: CoA transferase [Deltaproteobacteria bacterium]|nr:CoA transferase [Deltaproteobacteria bacterium]MBI3387795.1 CoA transferase [Deltaproteobacteria bacterium]
MNVVLNGKSTGPCAGLTVLDFSTVFSGPMCTMILGDLGAEVIKIEAPRGDSTRMMGPPFKGGLSAMFTHFNRNKRSVVIDLKHTDGQAIAQRLAGGVDVIVQNFRPKVAARLGIDYATLSARNPKLVYLAISGFGPDGPYADHPAYDTVIQGLTGFMPVQGAARGPELVKSMIADKSTALTATYGVLAALLARERTGGRGQLVDLAMLDAFAAFVLPEALTRETFLPADEWKHLPNLTDIHRAWATADGHVVMMIIEDSQFHAICRVLEREDLIGDERYANLMLRIVNGVELIPQIETALRQLPTATVVERARRFGAPLAPANGIPEFLADPQVAANRTVFEAEHAEAGTIRYLRNPVRLHDTPPTLRRHPPRLGEHTDEVLREAGYDTARLATLRASGIIA